MPSYACLQPDGKIAVFSSIVDSFTLINATESEAVEYFHRNMGLRDAQEKVARGVRDEEIFPGEKKRSTLHRWHESLKTIRAIHGEKGMKEVLSQFAEAE